MIDPEALMSRRLDRVTSYTDNQVMLYNLSIGMGRDPLDPRELPFIFERPALQVVPTAATVLAGDGPDIFDGVDIDWPKVLHGEQRLTVHRTLPPAADISTTTRITEVVDKGADKGAVITVSVDVRLTSGEALYTVDSVVFARGDGGFGGQSRSAHAPHTLPERAPDIVHHSETRPEQAAFYRLNGDRNPLHIEPAFAQRGGFPRPILHGLCSYGIACRALLVTLCDYDPGRIRQLDVRFTSPVFPGETIRTDIWVDGDIVSFRSSVEARGVTSLSNGYCRLQPSA